MGTKKRKKKKNKQIIKTNKKKKLLLHHNVKDIDTKKTWGFFILFIITVTFISYASCLNGTWALDDPVISKVEKIKNFKDFFTFRGISYLTFYINYITDKSRSLNILRITNILIHIINSLLLAFVINITLSKFLEIKGTNKFRYFIVFFISIIFALHPINAYAVSYIIQRMSLLATLFFLLSIITYIFSYLTKTKSIKLLLNITTLFLLGMGILSKENVIIGIFLILLYDYIFINKLKIKIVLSKNSFFWISAIVLMFIFLFYFGYYNTFISLLDIYVHPNTIMSHKVWMATDVNWTPFEHILTEFRIVGKYLILIILPLSSLSVLDAWGYPLSHKITDPPITFLAFSFIIFCLIFSFIKRKKFPFLFFGIYWYFIGISLESFVAVGADLYFEHRNYLPFIGILIAFSCFLYRYLSTNIGKNIIFLSLFIVTILGFLNFQKNSIWKDRETLYLRIVKNAPYNTRAIVTLAKIFDENLKYPEAEFYFKKAYKLALIKRETHFFQESAIGLGCLYIKKEDLKEVSMIIKAFNKYYPNSPKLLILTGLYFCSKNQIEKGLKYFFIGLKNLNEYKEIALYLSSLGDIYKRFWKFDEAAKFYKKALKFNPYSDNSLYGLAYINMIKGKYDQSEDFIERMLLKKEHYLGLSLKAQIALLKKDDVNKALLYATKAMANFPSMPEPYLVMGMIMLYKDNTNKAEEFFKLAKGQWLKAKNYEILFYKTVIHILKNQKDKANFLFKKILNDPQAPDGLKNYLKLKITNIN